MSLHLLKYPYMDGQVEGSRGKKEGKRYKIKFYIFITFLHLIKSFAERFVSNGIQYFQLDFVLFNLLSNLLDEDRT